MSDQAPPSWIIEPHPGVEVYVGHRGHVVIKQIETDVCAGEPSVVIVDPCDIAQLIEHLQSAAVFAKAEVLARPEVAAP